MSLMYKCKYDKSNTDYSQIVSLENTTTRGPKRKEQKTDKT